MSLGEFKYKLFTKLNIKKLLVPGKEQILPPPPPPSY